MEGNISDLLPLLDFYPSIRKQIQIILQTNKYIWEVNQSLTRLDVRYIGQSKDYFWFEDQQNGNGFTVEKKYFNMDRLETAVEKLRGKQHVRIGIDSHSPTPVS